MFIRYEEMYLLAVTKLNSNCSLVFEFLYKLVTVFKAYFEDKLDEDSLRDNFSLVYELLDGK